MLSECNQLLYPQLNSMRLTNNGNLAMLARNSLSHFALASGWVLKSFLHGEQRKEISAPSILSRMLKYLNINSFVLVITSSYIWHSAFPFSLLVLFYVKCRKHAPSLSFFLSPRTNALIRETVCAAGYLLHWPRFSFPFLSRKCMKLESFLHHLYPGQADEKSTVVRDSHGHLTFIPQTAGFSQLIDQTPSKNRENGKLSKLAICSFWTILFDSQAS